MVHCGAKCTICCQGIQNVYVCCQGKLIDPVRFGVSLSHCLCFSYTLTSLFIKLSLAFFLIVVPPETAGGWELWACLCAANSSCHPAEPPRSRIKGKIKRHREKEREGSRGVKRLQSCWAEGETSWHIPHSELGPDQNGCVIKWTVMLVPDTPQPSLELVTVLFSPKAPFRGQRLFASITVCSQSSMCVHTHAHPKSRCASRQGALPVLKNPTEEPLKTEERETGVKPNRLVLPCLVQAPWVFFQWKTQREGGTGERERCEGDQ